MWMVASTLADRVETVPKQVLLGIPGQAAAGCSFFGLAHWDGYIDISQTTADIYKCDR